MSEVYVSTDIESDGPIPGPYSMLSMASVAYGADGSVLGEFTANLDLLPDAVPDPDTMKWWESQGDAYARTRTATESPAVAMVRYTQWLASLPGKPVFMAYPAGFDYTFVRWYLVRFTGKDPFSFAALDLKTLGMALLGCNFRDSTKRRFPREWFDSSPHTHVALDDAREQGAMGMKMLRKVWKP